MHVLTPTGAQEQNKKNAKKNSRKNGMQFTIQINLALQQYKRAFEC
jgi:hypothetical protein